MMTAGVYYNKKYFSDNQTVVESIEKQLKSEGVNYREVISFADLDGLDVLFVLGGDGTILMLAAECAKRGVKIIGINYGHLGFLAEFEPKKARDAVKLVCGQNYKTCKRSMIEAICGDAKYYALNDVVLQRSTSGNDFSNTINLRAEIDGSVVDNFLADGIIVSTPTGSTAYSLSAGGSILTPDINALIMTPICAHSLHSRPVVYNDNSVLEVFSLKSGTPINLIVDGRIVGELDCNNKIIIKKSDYFVEFITKDENNFFNKLSIKLNIWSK